MPWSKTYPTLSYWRSSGPIINNQKPMICRQSQSLKSNRPPLTESSEERERMRRTGIHGRRTVSYLPPLRCLPARLLPLIIRRFHSRLSSIRLAPSFSQSIKPRSCENASYWLVKRLLSLRAILVGLSSWAVVQSMADAYHQSIISPSYPGSHPPFPNFYL